MKLDWHLTIAGSGEFEYVQHLKLEAERLNIRNAISWVGFINPEDKIRLMGDHDLLVLFSKNENFANVVIESLSVGLPVAISCHVGLSDFVKEHDLGWVSVDQIHDITNILEQAYADSDKRALINSKAPSIIKQYFNEQKICESYIDLYQKI